MEPQQVLVDCWRLVEKHGGRPTIALVSRMARTMGCKVRNDVAYSTLRPFSKIGALPGMTRGEIGESESLTRGEVGDDSGRTLGAPTRARSKVLLVPNISRVCDFGDDEPIVSRLVVAIAAANKSGGVTVGRIENERFALHAIREKYGVDAFRHAAHATLTSNKTLRKLTPYLEAIAKNYTPGLFAGGPRATAPRLAVHTPDVLR